MVMERIVDVLYSVPYMVLFSLLQLRWGKEIGVVGALLDVCEYADTLGLDKQKMFEVLVTCTSSSRQMQLMYPRFISGNDEPGFMIRHYVKDLGIARDEVQSRGGRLPVTDLMVGFYEKLMEKGMADKDFSAVVENWK